MKKAPPYRPPLNPAGLLAELAGPAVIVALMLGLGTVGYALFAPRQAIAQFAPKQVLTAAQLNAALAAPAITGGTINGAPIGQTSASLGTFTNLSALVSATISPSGPVVMTPSGTMTIFPATAGTVDNVVIGFGTTPLDARVATLTITQAGLTGSIGGANLAAGACSTGTASISNVSTAMTVLATPQVYPGDAIFWKGYVTSTSVVTVKVCAVISATPISSAYRVRIVQ